MADVDFVGTKEFDKDALKKALREIGLTEGRPLRPGAGRPRRAGTQAPVHQPQPVRRRSGDHGDADRAQPRQPDLHRDRRRAGQDQGNPHRRQQGLQRIHAAAACSTWTPAAGCQLVHQVRPLLARQAQCRPGDAALLLPDARLPRVPHRLDPGRDLAEQAGHHASPSTSPRASATSSPASSSKATTSARTTSSSRWCTIRPGEPYNADQVAETTKAFTDYFGNFGYAFAQVEARPEIDRANNRVALRAGGRALAPRLRAPHQRGRQQPHARRSRSAASSASSSRAGTTATRSSCRATASTAWASSRKSTSRPATCPARPTRST